MKKEQEKKMINGFMLERAAYYVYIAEHSHNINKKQKYIGLAKKNIKKYLKINNLVYGKKAVNLFFKEELPEYKNTPRIITMAERMDDAFNGIRQKMNNYVNIDAEDTEENCLKLMITIIENRQQTLKNNKEI